MPTYEYRCPDGHGFEKSQKMTERPRAKCPVCGKPAARKISGGAALVFKGSGFYITDYGKDGKGPRKEPATSGGENVSGGETASKSDAAHASPKPATEPAAKAGSSEPSSSSSKKKKAAGE